MLGRFAYLGATGQTGRVGAGLAVVHDRLYISGGVHEGTGAANQRSRGFDESVARWEGTRADLPSGGGQGESRSTDGSGEQPGAGSGESYLDVSHRHWRRVEGLNLPTAMHAHEAIAIPWLPFLP